MSGPEWESFQVRWTLAHSPHARSVARAPPLCDVHAEARPGGHGEGSRFVYSIAFGVSDPGTSSSPLPKPEAPCQQSPVALRVHPVEQIGGRGGRGGQVGGGNSRGRLLIRPPRLSPFLPPACPIRRHLCLSLLRRVTQILYLTFCNLSKPC